LKTLANGHAVPLPSSLARPLRKLTPAKKASLPALTARGGNLDKKLAAAIKKKLAEALDDYGEFNSKIVPLHWGPGEDDWKSCQSWRFSLTVWIDTNEDDINAPSVSAEDALNRWIDELLQRISPT